jgi:hypothetical protein
MKSGPEKSMHRKRIMLAAGMLIVAAAAGGLAGCSARTGAPGNTMPEAGSPATLQPTATATHTATPKPTRKPTRTPHPEIHVVSGQLLYVKHESVSRGRGLPDTYQYYSFHFQPAPPGSPLREYIRAVQRLAVPNMSADDFENNMAGFWAGNRALSNGHDYEKDFAVGPVITGGAMVRATGNVMYKAGRALVEVFAIDSEHLPAVPAGIDALDWTLHFRPTIVSPYLRPDGRWLINPFPQFDGWGIAPLLGSDGRQWLDADILVPIDAPVGPFEYPAVSAWPSSTVN